jgi:methionyl-tRNA synthetase
MARHLVTSALPYVNSIKHLGNVIGSLLPADVHARWLRSEGHEVRLICGTDEHGAPALLSARRAGEPVEVFCDRLHALQAEQYRRLGLSFDRFGRTSGPGTRAVTLEIYERLRERGFIVKRPLTQCWSETDRLFLPDRLLLGTCPRCGSEEARGDQCESCGRLLDPADLLAPRSALSGSTDLQWRESEHVFLRLSALAQAADDHLQLHPEWPALTRQIASAWLRDGLADRCISRDLSWGIGVPDLPGKVFWCWFDAPLGYAGILRDLEPDWESWWNGSTITQFLGKDNVPFHAIWLPATLAGAGGLRLPDRVHGLHWLLWDGKKFSTSQGEGLFVDRALELLPADVWRWVLLAQTPETGDSWFSWDAVVRVANKDLAGQLGNLVHRLLGLLAARGGRVPELGEAGPEEETLWELVHAQLQELRAAHERIVFRDVIEALRGLLHLANRYVDQRAPWRLLGTPEGDVVLRTSCELLRALAVAIRPVLPFTSDRIGTVLALEAHELQGPISSVSRPGGLQGRPITPIPPLFARLELAQFD